MEKYIEDNLPEAVLDATKFVNESLASNALSRQKLQWELWNEERNTRDYHFSHEYGSRCVFFQIQIL